MIDKKQIFIIGCIRSGTSFFCDMFLDFVDNVYNETGERDVSKRKNLINDNFAFKFCEDFNHLKEIKELFPYSTIILVIRDLRDVVYSTYIGDPNSKPPRVFPAVSEIAKKNNISHFEASIKIVENYYRNIENALEQHPDKIDKIIYYQDIINPIKLKILFDELFPNNKKSIDYFKSKTIKTPNQNIWKTFDSTKKNQFKESNLEKLLIKYNFEKW